MMDAVMNAWRRIGAMNRETKLWAMIILTGAYFFVEIIVGRMTNCMALIADAFHVLSDEIALVITLLAVKGARQKKEDDTYSYGWKRAELVGALVNAVFLLALCLTIVMEAVHRLMEPEEVEQHDVLIVAAAGGLLVNLLGLVVFKEHGHLGGCNHGCSHEKNDGRARGHASACGHAHSQAPKPYECGHGHAHGHSHAHPKPSECGHGHAHGHSHAHPKPSECGHGSHGHAHSHAKPEPPLLRRGSGTSDESAGLTDHDSLFSPMAACAERRVDMAHVVNMDVDLEAPAPCSHGHSHGHAPAPVDIPQEGDLNTHALYLHILGDALGSVAVIIATIIMWQWTSWEGRNIVDPVLSLVFTGWLIKEAVPLVFKTARMLLQATPEQVSLGRLRTDLQGVRHVEDVASLHVWQLTESQFVGSVRLTIAGDAAWARVVEEAEGVFRQHRVKDVTIQPVPGSAASAACGAVVLGDGAGNARLRARPPSR
eukprot:TRINITY_DN2226_c1_g2_i1.p1 TRINITY_DN2226_c1_g2~~TRINITY_DN2226_c1_g2_i1.p1  ORF type:complete len:484 (+),score=148.63 TRINITY_DN2226_c1_g2_i1:110-1561(+)